jgi:hypothetical protein
VDNYQTIKVKKLNLTYPQVHWPWKSPFMFLTVIRQSVAVPWKWTSLAALAQRVSNTIGYALSQFFKYTSVSVCYHSICNQGLKPKGHFIFSRKCPLSRDFTNPPIAIMLYIRQISTFFLLKSKFANITMNYSLKRANFIATFYFQFCLQFKNNYCIFGKCFCESKPAYVHCCEYFRDSKTKFPFVSF